jgi:hypothetical protein
MKLTKILILLAATVSPLGAQPLVLPEYPGDLAEAALSMETGDGDLFRLFLAEVIYVSATARDEPSYVPAAAQSLQDAVVRYPDLIGWINGGLVQVAREAKIEMLVGDVGPIQAGVDSLVCHQMVTEGVLQALEQLGVSADALPLIGDLCASPEARRTVLAVIDRVYRESKSSRREQLLSKVFKPELFEQAVVAINGFIQGRDGGLDLGTLVDSGGITAGMPPKYAELLNDMLPVYYSRFRDRHRLLIHYLMAEPSRRTAALFQASGPALQKVVQMVADYTNNPSVRSQLSELKSGVQAYGEKDIKPIIDEVLARSTDPEFYKRLTVNYDAIGSGTIAQAHIVTLDR